MRLFGRKTHRGQSHWSGPDFARRKDVVIHRVGMGIRRTIAARERTFLRRPECRSRRRGLFAVYMQHRRKDPAYGFGRDERMVETVQAALFLKRNLLRQAVDGIADGGVLHRKLPAAERSCRQYQQGE